MIPIERAKTRFHAEYHILKFLIEGENANMNSLQDLARQMGADLDDSGNPIDPVAFKRFQTGAAAINEQLERLLKQREKKVKS